MYFEINMELLENLYDTERNSNNVLLTSMDNTVWFNVCFNSYEEGLKTLYGDYNLDAWQELINRTPENELEYNNRTLAVNYEHLETGLSFSAHEIFKWYDNYHGVNFYREDDGPELDPGRFNLEHMLLTLVESVAETYEITNFKASEQELAPAYKRVVETLKPYDKDVESSFTFDQFIDDFEGFIPEYLTLGDVLTNIDEGLFIKSYTNYIIECLFENIDKYGFI